jgi:transcriptional regulator with XRE-family HTH domain
MGRKKWTDDYFGKRLRRERDSRGWSQAQLAKMLSDKDIPMHWTTVAKIEAGDRSVRIDEAAGIADLFGVSVDGLLGRRPRPKADLFMALRGVLEAARSAAWQVSALETGLRDQLAELTEADSGEGYAELITDGGLAADALAEAGRVLARVGERPDAGVKRATEEVMNQWLKKQEGDE